MKRIYKKCKSKSFYPSHVAEVGVYLPDTSNILDFIKDGVRATLVEAHPAYVEHIRDFFANNPKVTLHPVAVSEQEGEIALVQREASTFLAQLDHTPSITNDHYKIQEVDKIVVPTQRFSTIDDGTIDLLSADIEGAEWYVIKYMKSTPAVISLETHGKRYTNPFMPEIQLWMTTHHYRVWYKDNSDTVYVKEGIFRLNILEKISLFFKNVLLAVKRLKKAFTNKFASGNQIFFGFSR